MPEDDKDPQTGYSNAVSDYQRLPMWSASDCVHSVPVSWIKWM